MLNRYSIAGSYLRSTHVAHGTTEEVEALSVGDLPVLTLGCATKNDLRSLGGSSKRRDISDSSALDGHEREEESEEDGKNGHSNGHVVLNTEDNANADDGEEQTGSPHPHLDLLVRGGRVLNKVLVCLGTSLLGPGQFTTELLANSVETGSNTTVESLESEVDDLVLKYELGEGDGNHEKHTRPQHPVTGRRPVLVASSQAERSEVSVSVPFGAALAEVSSPGHVVVHKSRSDDGPGKDGATKERERDVETDKHTGTDEGRCPLKEPTPRFNGESERVVLGPDVEPGEEVPVPKNSGSVLGHDTEYQSARESNGQTLHLQFRNGLTGDGLMHGSDGHGGSRRRGEDQAELTRNVNNEELAQRRSEEEAKVSRDGRKSDNDHVVVFGCGAQKLELVHGRERGDENVGKTTGGHGSRLADVVLTWAEATTENRPTLRNNLGQELDDSETGDSLKTC